MREAFEKELRGILGYGTHERDNGSHTISLTREELYRLYTAQAPVVPDKRRADVYLTEHSSPTGFPMIPPRDGYQEKYNEGWNDCVDAMLKESKS